MLLFEIFCCAAGPPIQMIADGAMKQGIPFPNHLFSFDFKRFRCTGLTPMLFTELQKGARASLPQTGTMAGQMPALPA